MANKKINQLVSKTAILSTDLFGIGDATTGQLFKKTIAELQAAIGGAVISVNGLVGTVVLDTDDIQELATPTNKYFTDARARGAISLTVTGNSGASTYSSGTGVLNVPTYTLAGLGGITASFLSGASGISYNSTTGVISYSGTVYTDASIRALLSGGTGISYNSSTGAISYSGTVYTDSSVRALISLTTTGTSGASTYNNTTGVINVPEYTLAGLGGISLTSLSGGTGITYNNTTGAISYSGTVYTDASVRALVSATGSVSYNNTTGVISLSGGNLTEATSSVLTITGGTGAVLGAGTSIQVKQASSTVSGFLSSTDWSTFNNKQSTLTNPVTGIGTSGYHAKFTSSTTIGNSVIYDDGTNVGIGTSTITSSGGWTPTLVLNATSAALIIKGINGQENSLGTSNGFYIDCLGSSTASNNNIIFRTSNTNSNFNATERMRITSDGAMYMSRVNSNLTFTDSTGGIYVRQNGNYDNTQEELRIFGRNIGFFSHSGSRYAAITSAGNVGIGTGSPQVNANQISLTINGTDVSRLDFQVSGTKKAGFVVASDAVYLETNAAISMNFITDNSIRMKIFANGNTAIGTTTDNGYKLYVSGTIYATGNITANSDLTLKKNLELITNPIDKLMQLNGYSYQWKSDDSHQYGVIAQEVEKILPYAVSTGNDGIKGVSYNQIIPVLIEAVKEQKAKIENLEILLASK